MILRKIILTSIITLGLSWQLSSFGQTHHSSILNSTSNKIPACEKIDLMPDQAQMPCASILIFTDGTSRSDRANIVRSHNAALRFNFTLFNSAAVVVKDKDTLIALNADNHIRKIIPDRIINAIKKPSNPGNGGGGGGGDVAQVTPSGIERIGASPGHLLETGAGIGVAVVDTGLDMTNADLNVSSTCFTAYNSCDDGNGHGTHIGGTIAAEDNNIDVVGVAPNAMLYAVKSLDNSGSGSDSSVIAGLEWIAMHANSVAPNIKVVNMSLGRSGSLDDNPVLRQAVQELVNNMNISVVVAAGNDPYSEVTDEVPATYPEVMAVASSSAKDGNNNRCRAYSGIIPADTASYFTTDGAFNSTTDIGVTISAPGENREDIARSCMVSSVGILSLKAGGGTTRMSGTSMATPHVTGTVALMLEADNTLTPAEIRTAIRNEASDRGIAPLDSPLSSYSFDGEREGVLSACRVLGEPC